MSDIFSIMATTPGSRDSYWDSRQEPVLSLPNGREMVKSDYFNRGGAEKFGHGETIDVGHDRRECALPGCNNAKLHIDKNGYAYCPICSTIYNDGMPPTRPKSSDRILLASQIKRRKRHEGYKAF